MRLKFRSTTSNEATNFEAFEVDFDNHDDEKERRRRRRCDDDDEEKKKEVKNDL